VDIGSKQLILANVHMLNPIKFPWWLWVRGRTDQLDALFLWTDRTIRNEAVAAAG
jgi:hypothetical protein